MAQQKRARPVPASSQRSKKRQKIDPRAAKVDSDVKKIPVALDALPWNEVEMPEMFDDAEGFFGLEEVDDVEVIREGNQIKFVSAKPIAVDEDEFEGFDDDMVDVVETSQSKSKESTEVKPKSSKKDRAEAVKAKPSGADATSKPVDGVKESTKSKTSNSKAAKTALKTGNGTANSNDKKEKLIGDLPLTADNVFAALQEEDNEVDLSEWAALDLSSEILTALSKLRFTQPTPIQANAIPEILAGHDVIGKASTGSGKTLAFGIPVVERWLEEQRNGEKDEKVPTALILSPTRELAHQLTQHLTALCKGLSDAPRIVAVTGGLSIQKQQRQLENADIIIGTPGRLWEVMSSMIKSLNVKVLVVDEADRMLTDGHFKETDDIISALDRNGERQTLVFSATLAKGLQQKLSGKAKFGDTGMEYLMKKLQLKDPKLVDVAKKQMAAGLKEGMIECGGTEKDLYLYALLMHHPNQKTLIFTNSIHSVRRIVPLLQNLGLDVHALHSQMAQKARMKSIERFSSKPSVLVATDVAARGLDISGVQLVVHYHVPRAADMYVHRSGRTARANMTGSSILICAPEESQGVRRLVAKTQGYLRTVDLDRKVVARLKPRVVLAKKIADSALAKEKKGDDEMKKMAEELGVDYDSEEFEKGGKGSGRKKKEKEARAMTKGEVGALRAELNALLSHRVNVGVSERYLTGVDVNELLKGGDWLGKVEGIMD